MSQDFIVQSTLKNVRPLHAAIIMDGNGRWAQARGLPRLAGHRAGARAVRRVTETSPSLDIGILTLFAFSSDNWQRPAEEVSGLMQLLAEHLRSETQRCMDNGVRMQLIGRRTRLDPKLAAAIAKAEAATAGGQRLLLRIAVDYSARQAIADAAADAAQPLCRASLESVLGPPVDLLIRTGGEQRLSDFLLWECAYAELIFSPCMWPDFDGRHLAAAVREFHARERRFGGLPPAALAQNGHRKATHAWLD